MWVGADLIRSQKLPGRRRPQGVSLSTHSSKGGVVFLPASHEICKWGWSFREGEWLPKRICTFRHLKSELVHVPVPAHPLFWHTKGQEGPPSKPLHRQVSGKSHFFFASRPIVRTCGKPNQHGRKAAGDGQQQRTFIAQLHGERRKILYLCKEIQCSFQTLASCKLQLTPAVVCCNFAFP